MTDWGMMIATCEEGIRREKKYTHRIHKQDTSIPNSPSHGDSKEELCKRILEHRSYVCNSLLCHPIFPRLHFINNATAILNDPLHKIGNVNSWQ
jgi:hypothetical protein